MADRHTNDGPGTNRRTFLKTAAATVAVAASASRTVGSSVAQSTSEYETITVEGAELFDLHDDFGGTLENVIFDQTAPNSCAEIHAMGGDGVIRNVGFRGVADVGGSRHTLRPSARSSDAEVVIENVYMGDGAAPGTDFMGVYVEDDHAGTLTFRNCHIGHYSDNGLYAADPGYDHPNLDPAYGEVYIEECYAYNNNISGFRIGTNGSYIRDSVSVVDSSSDVPVHSNGGKNGRCVRFHNVSGQHAEGGAFYNDQGWQAFDADDGGGGEVRNASVLGPVESPIQAVGCTELSEGDVPQPPAGVPTSAEAAASGQGGDTDSGSGGQDGTDGGQEEDSTAGRFVVMSTTPFEEIIYRFWVDGDVSLVTDAGGQTAAEANDEEVSTDGEYTLVTGSTGNEYGDAFDVSGEVVAFQRTGGNSDYQLLDDGTDVTDDVPEQLPDDGSGGDSGNQQFTVVATTSGEHLSYRFVADGPIEPITDTDDPTVAAEPSGNDSVAQRDDGLYEATGHTGNTYGDSYAVSGDVLLFARTDGNSEWTLLSDGQDVTDDVPEQLDGDGGDGGSSGPRSGTLLIDGTANPDATSRYTFTVAESVSYDPDRSTTVDDGLAWDRMQDVVSGRTATGIVGNGVDAFQITGELESIDIRGDADYAIEWE